MGFAFCQAWAGQHTEIDTSKLEAILVSVSTFIESVVYGPVIGVPVYFEVG